MSTAPQTHVRNIYRTLAFIFHHQRGLSLQSLSWSLRNCATQICAFPVSEAAGIRPAQMPAQSNQNHISSIHIRNTQSSLPQLIVAIKHNGPLLHRDTCAASDPRNSHSAKDLRDRLQLDHRVHRERPAAKSRVDQSVPQTSISSGLSAERNIRIMGLRLMILRGNITDLPVKVIAKMKEKRLQRVEARHGIALRQ